MREDCSFLFFVFIFLTNLVLEIFALLGCWTTLVSSYRPLEKPICRIFTGQTIDEILGSTETSVTNYQPTVRRANASTTGRQKPKNILANVVFARATELIQLLLPSPYRYFSIYTIYSNLCSLPNFIFMVTRLIYFYDFTRKYQ